MTNKKRTAKEGTAERELAKKLRNVGPSLARKMLDAGIDSPQKLIDMGAREAYLAMYKSGDSYGDHNAAYLYALEGAIRDCAWNEIPDSVKQEYRDFARELQLKKS